MLGVANSFLLSISFSLV